MREMKPQWQFGEKVIIDMFGIVPTTVFYRFDCFGSIS